MQNFIFKKLKDILGDFVLPTIKDATDLFKRDLLNNTQNIKILKSYNKIISKHNDFSKINELEYINEAKNFKYYIDKSPINKISIFTNYKNLEERKFDLLNKYKSKVKIFKLGPDLADLIEKFANLVINDFSLKDYWEIIEQEFRCNIGSEVCKLYYRFTNFLYCSKSFKNYFYYKIKYELEDGFDVNKQISDQGNRLIHFASDYEDIDLLDLLYSYNADFNIVNKNGETALDLALKENKCLIAEKILSHNFAVKFLEENFNKSYCKKFKNMHWHINEEIKNARKNFLELIKYSYKKPYLDILGIKNEPPQEDFYKEIKKKLHYLAQNFHPDKVSNGFNSKFAHEFFILFEQAKIFLKDEKLDKDLLDEFKKGFNNFLNENFWFVLINNFIDVKKTMLGSIFLDVYFNKLSNNNLFLEFIKHKDNEELVNYKNLQGYNLLHYAAMIDDNESAFYLLNNGLSVNENIDNNKYYSPYDIALEKNNCNVAKIFYQHHPASTMYTSKLEHNSTCTFLGHILHHNEDF